MKLYLAGPMTGYPAFNFPAFAAAAAWLRKHGHEVFDPSERDLADGFDPVHDEARELKHYMAVDLPEVCRSDGIALLPGWRDSQGARLEYEVARQCGLSIYYMHDIGSDQDASWMLADHEDEAEEETPYEVRVKDPDTGGEKGIKRARYDLIPVGPLRELAEHYGKNCKDHGGKYEADNWRRGYSWNLSFRSAIGHLQEFWAGRDLDPENDSKHVIAAAWHCLALAEFMETTREKDNRPCRKTNLK